MFVEGGGSIVHNRKGQMRMIDIDCGAVDGIKFGALTILGLGLRVRTYQCIEQASTLVLQARSWSGQCGDGHRPLVI